MTAIASPAAIRRIASARSKGWAFRPIPTELAALCPSDGSEELGILSKGKRMIVLWTDGFAEEIDALESIADEIARLELFAGWDATP